MIGPGLHQGFGRRVGLRQGFGRWAGRLRRALALGALGAAAMALLLPSLAALRYTDAQDWYAASKASVAQALIFAGFDERAAMRYRLADGRTVTSFREGVAAYPAALQSRKLILAVIGDNILLGAVTGFVAVFTLSGLLNLARHKPAGVSGAAVRGSPAAERQPGFIEDLPPYTMDGPDRVPAGTAGPANVREPERTVSAVPPDRESRPNAAGPSPSPAAGRPEPPVEAKLEEAYEPPARPRGRWF